MRWINVLLYKGWGLDLQLYYSYLFTLEDNDPFSSYVGEMEKRVERQRERKEKKKKRRRGKRGNMIHYEAWSLESFHLCSNLKHCLAVI